MDILEKYIPPEWDTHGVPGGTVVRTDKLKKFIDDDILEIVGDIDSFETTTVALLAQLVRNTTVEV